MKIHFSEPRLEHYPHATDAKVAKLCGVVSDLDSTYYVNFFVMCSNPPTAEDHKYWLAYQDHAYRTLVSELTRLQDRTVN